MKGNFLSLWKKLKRIHHSQLLYQGSIITKTNKNLPHIMDMLMDIAKVTLPNQPDTIQWLHKCIRYAVASDLVWSSKSSD